MDESTALSAPVRIIRDREPDDVALKELIGTDVLGRNKHLVVFIDFVNSVDGGAFISLDGGWGSGKTVFVKQLDYLNTTQNFEEIYASRNKETLERFQENYVTHYYNAWANDYHQNPLQSLLLSLLQELPEIKEGSKSRFNREAKIARRIAVDLFTDAGANLIEKLSFGFFNPDKITESAEKHSENNPNPAETKTIELYELAKEAIIELRLKAAISEFMNAILPEGKKLLFIIDELDRCSPTFAVRLLEAVKHYCLEGRIVFLLATNNSQLAHTVKKIYGQDSDGTGYLDRFYDIRFRLPDPNPETYIASQLQASGIRKMESYVTTVSKATIRRFFMPSLREINRYCTMLGYLQKYLDSQQDSAYAYEKNPYIALVRYIFAPLALALVIKDMDKYEAFITGQGSGILKEFLENTEEASQNGIIRHDFLRSFLVRQFDDRDPESEKITDGKKAVDYAVSVYEKIALKVASDENTYRASEEFKKITNLLQLTVLN